jgi:hypothetical protein
VTLADKTFVDVIAETLRLECRAKRVKTFMAMAHITVAGPKSRIAGSADIRPAPRRQARRSFR